MTAPTPRALKTFSALIGVTSLAIFVQAIVAGEFVSQDHRKGWIDVHSIVADVVVALALVTMIVTIVTLRKSSRLLLTGAIVLFVLTVIQTFLGHEITDNNQDWLIGIHVPLAFLIFGLAVWLPVQAVMLRRGLAKSAAA